MVGYPGGRGGRTTARVAQGTIRRSPSFALREMFTHHRRCLARSGTGGRVERNPLSVQASEEDWSDTDECVSGLFEEIRLDPAVGEAVEDANGEPFEISEDGHAAAAYIFPIEVDGDTQDQLRLVECVDDEPYASLFTCVSLDDENILGVEFTAPGVETTTDEASARIGDLLDMLAF